MAKYVFINFPTYGQMNPTLAIVRELVARGEDVVYFAAEPFRSAIEAAGATFQSYEISHFQWQRTQSSSAVEDDRRLALLPIRMIQLSRDMVPLLMERVQAEHPDCLVYSGLFLWARMASHALGIPGVALWPTYAPGFQPEKPSHERLSSLLSLPAMQWLPDELIYLRDAYHLPSARLASLIRGDEDLTLVFLPCAFQPDGDQYDERFLFVGPSFLASRDSGHQFSLERLVSSPRLYISLGTLYNNQAQFYNTCFRAFGHSEWQVILSIGTKFDVSTLQAVPENFVVAAQVPQLEVLPQTDIFLSHGGMNSTMESLYFCVPLIIIPHTREQKKTAQRVVDLGLGVALDETMVSADALREAVAQIALDPLYKERVRTMQQLVREAGGYQRATDALQAYVQNKSVAG